MIREAVKASHLKRSTSGAAGRAALAIAPGYAAGRARWLTQTRGAGHAGNYKLLTGETTGASIVRLANAPTHG